MLQINTRSAIISKLQAINKITLFGIIIVFVYYTEWYDHKSSMSRPVSYKIPLSDLMKILQEHGIWTS